MFRLNGTNLTAYHEVTKQRRMNINLAKAAKLIDDGSSLKQIGSKIRRKSAFAEDEEGYMFLPESFRIAFPNETINFYADTVQQKEEWMQVLSEAVGKDSGSKKIGWTSLVLAKEREAALTQALPSTGRRQSNPQAHPRTTSRSAPTSPAKGTRPQSAILERPPPPISKSSNKGNDKKEPGKPQARNNVSPTRQPKSGSGVTPRQQKPGNGSGRRQAVRSMIF